MTAPDDPRSTSQPDTGGYGTGGYGTGGYGTGSPGAGTPGAGGTAGGPFTGQGVGQGAGQGVGQPAGSATGVAPAGGPATGVGSRAAEPVQVPERQPWNAGIADPGPLGLAGFAMTTMVLSVVNARILPATVEPVVFGLAFFYGGLAQLLAGMWEFVKGNTFGAVAFSSYGAFWLSFWYLATHEALLKGNATQNSKAVGVYLLGWAIFTAYMTVASIRTTGAITAVFVALTITYLFLALADLTQTTNLAKIGGYLGLVTAALAWYASFAGVLNATARRTVLPVFPNNA